MADEYILKHLQDALDAINELEGFFADFPKRFDLFEKDKLKICAVERKTEIMGEAINRIRKKDPTFDIPNAKDIINTEIASSMDTTVWKQNSCGDLSFAISPH